eukprot:TRINITY_DN3322_c1_g1_i3.p1 TRINITY_DN3322_c1_g1~~TRINITY_DN3322_c1_g1_i3.p1  ORF type:complete len:426 (+),score=95.68 TRINITY_DN3322_c1_g1_i3:375-1652(+)
MSYVVGGETDVIDEDVQKMIREGNVPRQKIPDKVESLLEAAKNGVLAKINEAPEKVLNEGDAMQRTALHFAAHCNQYAAIELLLQRGAKINATDNDNYTPLMLALKGGNYNIVELLIGKGADVNTQTPKGVTPLHLAALGNDIKSVKKLIESGAILNRASESGSALHFVCDKSDLEIPTLLLEKDKSLLNSVDSHGMSPLHVACAYNNTKLAMFFLEHGANPNFSGKGNVTPLHIATDTENLPLVKVLLEKGALLRVDLSGLTPLNIAKKNNNRELQNLLSGVKVDESEIPQSQEPVAINERANPEKLKDQGNAAFAKKDYNMALEYYTLAIDVDSIVQELNPFMQGKTPITHVLYSNRSATYFHLRKFQKALEDAEKAISLAPEWSKGWTKKHACLIAIKKREEALLLEKKNKEQEEKKKEAKK